MLAARITRSFALFVSTSVVLLTSWALAGPASAQKPLPPRVDELTASKPWTYLMAWALLAGVVLVIGLATLAYLIKGRGFRANQRRGGSK